MNTNEIRDMQLCLALGCVPEEQKDCKELCGTYNNTKHYFAEAAAGLRVELDEAKNQLSLYSLTPGQVNDMTLENDRLKRRQVVASSGLSVREAARQRMPLGGADAQGLEGALQQAEREFAEKTDENDRLKKELDRYKQAHETVHEKFGFVNDGTGKCACAYCKGDAETLMNMCAHYEMENDRLKKELGTLKEDDKFVCMRCDKEMIAELAELKIEKEDLKEKIVGLEAELQHIKGITAEDIRSIIEMNIGLVKGNIVGTETAAAAIVARIKGEA